MEILKHVGNTIFGMYQQKFCREWDSALRKIINECEVSEFSERTITFTTKHGQVCVWCSNKWYAFGHLYEVNGKGVGGKNERRPRFETMQTLHRLHSRLCREKSQGDYSRLMERVK